MDKESKAYKSGEFEEMFHASEISSLVKEDAVLYSQSRLRLQEMIDAVNFASNESFEKGIEKGIEQGIEKGRHEERLLLARNMLSSGYSPDEIMRLTGISMESLK